MPVLRTHRHRHDDWVTSVAFSLDGTRIVSGSYDNTIPNLERDHGEGDQEARR